MECSCSISHVSFFSLGENKGKGLAKFNYFLEKGGNLKSWIISESGTMKINFEEGV